MSIWGKVIGGLAGFALGGPLGALLGATAGHAVDRARTGTDSLSPPGAEQREIAFTLAVIVLAAKMAKADGHVSKKEIATFRRIFHIPPGEVGDVGRLFNEARRDAHGYEPYARQIADMFAHDKSVLEELLAALHHIAMADGEPESDELTYLRSIAVIFGFGPVAFEGVRARHTSDREQDPYRVLDLVTTVGDDEVRRRFRALVRENHPDVLMAKGMPKEFVDLANEKMAAINVAYDCIVKKRGMK
jgi:DnaJ like chaperone protein